jgi:Na+:H+ antiporter, NhaA family
MAMKKNYRLTKTYVRFLDLFSDSGILLIIATVIALLWANSAWGDQYDHLWHHTTFTLGFEGFKLEKHLIHWINDGLMVIFFFLVGLEIKREILVGELKSVKKASLPIFGALGGMLIPVLLYKMFGLEGEAAQGWGIPMATDIAFTVAVLAMLGSRVPLSLKIFLTALAIVDDLGAVFVIAIFYTQSINWMFLAIALGLVSILFIMNRLNIQNLWGYTSIGFAIWLLFLSSGIHATIAGVIVAFLIPVSPKVEIGQFAHKIKLQADRFARSNSHSQPYMLTEKQIDAIDNLQRLTIKVQSPLQAIEHNLSKFVNYIILPLFALSNAGVHFFSAKGGDPAGSVISAVGITIAVSLVFGKAIGISLFSWLAVKLNLAQKPEGTNWSSFIGLGLLGGIGFTMSLFITTLAFTSPELINQAKIGIFVGSLVAGIAGYFLLKISTKGVQTS